MIGVSVFGGELLDLMTKVFEQRDVDIRVLAGAGPIKKK